MSIAKTLPMREQDGSGVIPFPAVFCTITGAMKYLLPCPCGLSVEVEPGQAGQTAACACGENLTVPTMLQIKALPPAPEKREPVRKKVHVPYRAALTAARICAGCLALTLVLRYIGYVDFFFILFRGLSCAFFFTSVALTIRELVQSPPLAEDTALCRSFFVVGVALLFPTFFLASYMYAWEPHPRHVSLKQDRFSFGSRVLHQNSTPIPREEHTILWMTDEEIDRMMPMDLYFYFLTLESPTFSYNFQENYEAIKDTYRIWWTVIIIVCILAFLSIIASFFMPRQTVVVTGWSGSEW